MVSETACTSAPSFFVCGSCRHLRKAIRSDDFLQVALDGVRYGPLMDRVIRWVGKRDSATGLAMPMGVAVSMAALLAATILGGCGGDQKVVPEHNQRKSEQLYGKQKMSMDSLNQTPSEQAGQRHDYATEPVEPAGGEEEEDEEE